MMRKGIRGTLPEDAVSLKSAWNRARKEARYHGWGAAAQVLFLGILRKFMRLERVHLFSFTTPPAAGTFSVVETRLATWEEIEQLRRNDTCDMKDLSQAEIGHARASGHECIVNVLDASIIGYSWMAPDIIRIRELGIQIELRPDEVHIYKGFTFPQARGRNVGIDRYLFWIRHVQKMGRAVLVSDYAFDNKSTLTRARKLNMTCIGSGTLIGVGSFQRLFVSGEMANRKVTPL
jgi:hypothetical protein